MTRTTARRRPSTESTHATPRPPMPRRSRCTSRSRNTSPARSRTAPGRPDTALPSEHELVAQFGISRMTANRALRELVEQGRVVRVAGVGSFVAEDKPQSTLLQIANIASEIRARGHDYGYRLMAGRACCCFRRRGRLARLARRRVGVPQPVPAPGRRRAGAAGRPLCQPARGARLPGPGPGGHAAQRIPGAPSCPSTRSSTWSTRCCPPPSRPSGWSMSASEPCLLLTRRTWVAQRAGHAGALPASRLALPPGQPLPRGWQSELRLSAFIDSTFCAGTNLYRQLMHAPLTTVTCTPGKVDLALLRRIHAGGVTLSLDASTRRGHAGRAGRGAAHRRQRRSGLRHQHRLRQAGEHPHRQRPPGRAAAQPGALAQRGHRRAARRSGGAPGAGDQGGEPGARSLRRAAGAGRCAAGAVQRRHHAQHSLPRARSALRATWRRWRTWPAC